SHSGRVTGNPETILFTPKRNPELSGSTSPNPCGFRHKRTRERPDLLPDSCRGPGLQPCPVSSKHHLGTDAFRWAPQSVANASITLFPTLVGTMREILNPPLAHRSGHSR